VADYQMIRYTVVDSVATVTLARPNCLNAIGYPMMSELTHSLDRLAADGARALILTGDGRMFSSGGDLTTVPPNPLDIGEGIEKVWNPFMEQLMNLPIPVISALNGPAIGVAVSFALAADFVIMERSAYFLLAFIRLGLIPDVGATWLLTKALGRQRATEVMMLGEKITSQQAQTWGLIYRIVEDGDAGEAARELAMRLVTGPTKAYGLLRLSIRAALDGTLTESLRAERIYQRDAGRTADHQEALAAFNEKRAASFSGK
jgi:2-(1,2-epoxy-1,2-dihydrophenyl)acetyl-CoA isomerase